MKGRNASHGRQIVYRQRIYTEPPLDKISTRCLLTCEYTNKLMMVFLSAFIKLRKATVSFVMCVCVCVCVCVSAQPHWLPIDGFL